MSFIKTYMESRTVFAHKKTMIMAVITLVVGIALYFQWKGQPSYDKCWCDITSLNKVPCSPRYIQQQCVSQCNYPNCNNTTSAYCCGDPCQQCAGPECSGIQLVKQTLGECVQYQLTMNVECVNPDQNFTYTSYFDCSDTTCDKQVENDYPVHARIQCWSNGSFTNPEYNGYDTFIWSIVCFSIVGGMLITCICLFRYRRPSDPYPHVPGDNVHEEEVRFAQMA